MKSLTLKTLMLEKNVIVLDDVMLGPQSKAEAYYTRGRHNNADTLYLTQSYFKLPRQTIRENANFFILFRQDRKNLRDVYDDHVSCDDISFEQFMRFCQKVWEASKNGYIIIENTREINNGKYRKSLYNYWIPDC